jgi:hypothetical protein
MTLVQSATIQAAATAVAFLIWWQQPPAVAGEPNTPAGVVLAAAPQGQSQSRDEEPKEPKLSPEEKMNRRFPQPVRVGDLIGLPVLDYQDSTIGYVREVVRTPDGKIQLVVPYGRWFGWVKTGGPFARRLVGVPLETVAILARQINALDMSREEFDTAPDFAKGASTPIPPGETIRIAIGRR